MWKVSTVRALPGYRLEVVFDDGVQGVFDYSDSLTGPVFEPLRDPARFSEVTIDDESGAVCWPDGPDLAPDAMYESIIWRTVPALEVSRFGGIVVKMFPTERAGPFFVAVFGDDEAILTIHTVETARGELPPDAHARAAEWAKLRRKNLLTNYARVRRGQTLRPIAPLP